ncbi:unnamed protein product [Paramecium primaurelia]|uniref:Transmembrane protein n=1 Tax=Paramecium primaurelia TaxID=5886 RepID=A0A8S1QQR7_PARPR|nr:unnamed protein product [Paramecium primaurelia]
MNDTSDSQMIKKENSNNQKKLDNSDSKANNQIKVYKRLIKNINEILNTFKQFNQEEEKIELNWTPFHYDRQKKESNEDQSSKDKQDVINDGPLPLLEKVIKTKKEKKQKKDGGNIYAMLQFDWVNFFSDAQQVHQFVELRYLQEKILQLEEFQIWSILSQQLGKDQKLIVELGEKQNDQYCISISLSRTFWNQGSSSNRRLSLYIKQKIDITEFLKQILTGFWQNDSDKVKIQNQYQTLQMIQETVLKTQNNIQILNLATEVLGDQVRNGAISEITSCNLYDLINQCFQQSKETINGFQKVFVNQQKNIQDYRQLKVIVTNQKRIQNKKLKKFVICREIKNLMGYKAKIMNINNMKINQMMKFKKFCNRQEVEKEIINTNIQKDLNSTFNINYKDIQDECNNVKILDKLSMNKYQKIINICNIFRDKCKFTEQIEIIFNEQYITHLNTNIEQFQSQVSLYQMQNQVSQYQVEQIEQQCEQLKQIVNLETQLLVQNAINYMKNEQMINNDGITVSNQFMNKFNNYLNQQNYFSMMIEIMKQAMKKALFQILNKIVRKNSLQKLQFKLQKQKQLMKYKNKSLSQEQRNKINQQQVNMNKQSISNKIIIIINSQIYLSISIYRNLLNYQKFQIESKFFFQIILFLSIKIIRPTYIFFLYQQLQRLQIIKEINFRKKFTKKIQE